MEIAAGTVVGGYEIRQLLGAGGQSAVYLAEDVARIDTASAETLARYLQAATLAHLGRPETMAAVPDPYSQVYWITLLARAEKESSGRLAHAVTGNDRSGN